jgi:ABC-type multidrug transport system ATPase subunit/ABC-type transporter Mla maintaining outer membrane lipid asymmetry permease subunit MlaE
MRDDVKVAAMTRRPTVAIENLTIISPGGATLLTGLTLAVAPGEVVLIVGPSGSGKTTLIRLLCGLLDRGSGWQAAGTLTHPGGQIDLARQDSTIGGLVFQNHALFDDLTAGENLRIVADHLPPAATFQLAATVGTMLGDIDPAQPVAACSGGQRQRLAIARTLLSDPALLLFDEPNAGLDIRASRWLAETIRELCRESGKPAIIVAHHLDDFITLADRVLLLDPGAATLRELPIDRPAIEAAMLVTEPGVPTHARPVHTALVHAVPAGTDPGDAVPAGPAVEPTARAANPWTKPLPRRSRAWWFLRYLREYLWLLFAAPSMLLYVGLGSAIVGFVTVWFGFSYHSFGGYLRAVLHDETLEGLGFLLSTVAVPFNTCLLLVARNSAIIAADLGNRVSGMQMQAMKNLHLPGRAYIVASILISLTVGSLVLVAAALVTAFCTSLATWMYLFPGQPVEYWQENFFRKLADRHDLLVDLGWVALKVVASALLGGGTALVIGIRSRRSASGVTQLIASAIIGGVTLTLLVHAVLMILQF